MSWVYCHKWYVGCIISSGPAQPRRELGSLYRSVYIYSILHENLFQDPQSWLVGI